MTPPCNGFIGPRFHVERAGGKVATQLGAAAKANDTAKAQSLAQQLQANNKKLNSTASDLGLAECAKNVEPQG